MIKIPETIEDMSWRRLNWLSFHRVIPAGGNGTGTVSIGDDGNFQSYYLGGQFTTLTAEDTDGGACQISVKIFDNGLKWEIFDNLMPLSLYCSPGRQRASGVAGDPSNPLFEPVEFPYKFIAGSTIRVDFANAAQYANEFWLIWYGNKEFKDFAAPPPREAA